MSPPGRANGDRRQAPPGGLALACRAAWCALAWCALAGLVPASVAAAPATGGDCTVPGTGPMRQDGADLVLHDPGGAVLARWPLRDAQGRAGTLLAVCALPQRQSFVVVVQGWLELWEISTDPAAPPIHDGLVHDYRMGEAIARPGHLGVRRIRLARPWQAVFADQRVPWLLATEQGSAPDAGVLVLHLDVRRSVGRLPLAADGGWPALAGRRFPWGPGPARP